MGDRFTTSTHELTAEDIIEYATEYDPQPFHTDEDAAKDMFLGGLAASCWLTTSLTMKLLVDAAVVPRNGVEALYEQFPGAECDQ